MVIHVNVFVSLIKLIHELSFFVYNGLFYIDKKKIEVPRYVLNKSTETRNVKDWYRHENASKSQSGTEPGVLRRKRPL